MTKSLSDESGFAWVIGAVPLTLIRAITEISNPKEFTNVYIIQCEAIRELCAVCRIAVELPNLDELMVRPYPYNYLETILYREFLLYGKATSEALVFGHLIGAAVFVDPDGITDNERNSILAVWTEAAEKANFNIDHLSRLTEQYFESTLKDLEFLDEVARQVLCDDEGSFWDLIFDCISIEPGIGGFSFDLKKLGNSLKRSRPWRPTNR